MSDLHARHLAWCRLRNLRSSTVEQRFNTLRRLERYLGFPPEDATAEQLTEWYATLERLSPEARGTELAHIRQFFKWLQSEGIRLDEPTVRLPRPRLVRGLPRPISDVDLEVALMTASDRVRPMLVLASYAGLRAAEIAGLRREDVLDDHEPPVLVVVDGKGGRQRVVPLHPEVEVALGPPLPQSGYLFRRIRGHGPLPPHMISQYCNRHLHSLGITATLHQIRHWFGTNIYQTTLDLRLTQDLMGHQSPVTTAGYAKWAGNGSEAVSSLSVRQSSLA